MRYILVPGNVLRNPRSREKGRRFECHVAVVDLVQNLGSQS